MLKKVLPAAAVVALAVSVAAQPAPAPLPPPPLAEVHNVASTLHGVTVNDPYRWLEDVKSAPAQAWLQAQGEAARAALERIEGRDAIKARLVELAQAQGDSVRGLLRMPGGRFYYLKRRPGESQYKLVMRAGLDGIEQILVDPGREAARTGIPHAINYFMPSWDGLHLAYGMSAGGSEDASLYLLDLASGRHLGRPIPRVHDTPLHWLPDSRSLTYTQLAPPKPGAPQSDLYKDARVMWLRVGAPARSARPVFGPTVTRGLGLDRLDMAELITVPGSAWVVARTTDTTVPEGKLFVARLAELGRPGIRWSRIASEADKVFDVALRGDELVLMTQATTPRRQIVGIDLRHADLARARTLAAQPDEGVLEAFALTPSGLMTEWRLGTSVQLRRYPPGDTAGQPLPNPAAGAVWLTSAPANDSESLVYGFTGWAEPPRWYRLDGDKSAEVSFGSRSVPPGLPELEVTDVTVPSHDGVRVPMTILHRKGLALDGSHPVLLNGYGAYGFTTSAYYASENIAWIERGGVLAFVNPRGSGAYGDDWHRAGFKTTKPNTWKDGIACARYLIAQGYGSERTMGIIGGSAGGIFVGRAVTEAPEMFAAAVFAVGFLDAVRAEVSANGATNTAEFGTVRDPAEFRALLEMSTYHAIRNGITYPGVLLVHGLNDPRVDVWHSAKTAARLQAAQAANPKAGPALLRLDAQAGHGIGSTLDQRLELAADIQSFLLWQMGMAALRE